MKKSCPSDGLAHCAQVDLEESLKQLDAYAHVLARRYVPRTTFHPDVLDLEIDELAERAIVDFWRAWSKSAIDNHKCYLRRTISNKVIDVVRRYRRHPMLSLPTDDDSGMNLGDGLRFPGASGQDPLEDIISRESLVERIEEVVAEIAKLTPRRRQAMICTLKDDLEEVSDLLAEAFKKYELDIEEHHWPEDEKELQSLKSARSAARKQLRLRLLIP